MHREFLGWDRLPLEAAVEYLAGRYQEGKRLDLRGLVIVVPVARMGRRLTERLAIGCHDRQWLFQPPRVTTLGRFPELLYPAQKPFAEHLVQDLAWAEALRALPAEQAGCLMAQLPPAEDRRGWLQLGRLLRGLHRELASEGWDFEHVVQHGGQIEFFQEHARWAALAELQRRYLQRLDGLGLWDRQTARRVAIAHRECRLEHDLILFGTVDLNRIQRQLLDQVSDDPQHPVTAVVFAPAAIADRFDEHGCLVPTRWQTVPIEVPGSQLEVVESPAEQAGAAVNFVAELSGRFRADQITIGVPSQALVPALQQQFERLQVAARYGVGPRLAESAPFRFLAAVARVLNSSHYLDFASLVRHPDLDPYLERQGVDGDWLAAWDRYYNDHLPSEVGRQWSGSGDDRRTAQEVWKHVDSLLQLLPTERLPLSAWRSAVGKLFEAVYGHRKLDREHPGDRLVLAVAGAVNEAFGQFDALALPLMPTMTAAEALETLLDQIRDATVAPPADPDAIELLGWLELAWDDAPALAVTSMNEGIVPQASDTELFLPNRLRARMGLEDHTRRYARDAYAMQVILHSRSALRWIVGRRSAEGDPLAPSRLLLALPPAQIAERIQSFVRAGGGRRYEAAAPAAVHGGLQSPPPERLEQPVTALRITDFRHYLACPYRFYLARLLRLDAIDDTAQEMSPGSFGTLLHTALQRFGTSELRESTSAGDIAEFLDHALHRFVRDTYGSKPLPAVQVQVAQLCVRLQAFAEQQARWAGQGWQILDVEFPDAGCQGLPFDVDGVPIWLRGRIDRIDRHRTSGELAILDYKSSDTARTPEKTHCRQGQWIDLQLPLYRHLAALSHTAETVRLGYIQLPKDVRHVGFSLAAWTESQLGDADQVARDVVRRIRQQIFWPPAPLPPAFSEPLAGICQDGVLRDGAESSTAELAMEGSR